MVKLCIECIFYVRAYMYAQLKHECVYMVGVINSFVVDSCNLYSISAEYGYRTSRTDGSDVLVYVMVLYIHSFLAPSCLLFYCVLLQELKHKDIETDERLQF